MFWIASKRKTSTRELGTTCEIIQKSRNLRSFDDYFVLFFLQKCGKTVILRENSIE